MDEPLLTPDDSRFVVLPVVYQDVWVMYKKAVQSFWIAEEIDLSKDLADWKGLSTDEKHFVTMILAFFAGADGLVNENLAVRFYNEVQNSECRLFLGFQITMEGIHQEVYANIIDAYIRDKDKKTKLFNAITEFDFIACKANFCKKYIQSSSSFAERLVAFACVEGIMFSGAFCAIFWLKKRGLLKGLTFSNELISRDEALHVEFAVLLYSKLNTRLSQSRFHAVIKEAVDIEIGFICRALPCRLIGMNSDLMSQYIKFVADRLCVQMGYPKIYDASNPFDWMELISLQSKSNFFENKVSDYALSTKDKPEDIFEFSSDF
jgi:ribonucleoside-diphosphate reductase subunit M2